VAGEPDFLKRFGSVVALLLSREQDGSSVRFTPSKRFPHEQRAADGGTITLTGPADHSLDKTLQDLLTIRPLLGMPAKTETGPAGQLVVRLSPNTRLFRLMRQQSGVPESFVEQMDRLGISAQTPDAYRDILEAGVWGNGRSVPDRELAATAAGSKHGVLAIQRPSLFNGIGARRLTQTIQSVKRSLEGGRNVLHVVLVVQRTQEKNEEEIAGEFLRKMLEHSGGAVQFRREDVTVLPPLVAGNPRGLPDVLQARWPESRLVVLGEKAWARSLKAAQPSVEAFALSTQEDMQGEGVPLLIDAALVAASGTLVAASGTRRLPPELAGGLKEIEGIWMPDKGGIGATLEPQVREYGEKTQAVYKAVYAAVIKE
jgi:hypothetical protein